MCLLSGHLKGRTQRATGTGNVSKKGRSANNSETTGRILFKFDTDVP